MHALDTAKQLAKDIQNTEEYKEYHACKEQIDGDEAIKALVKEYKKLQMTVQMGAAMGHPAPAEDQKRFEMLCGLLLSDQRTNQFLLSEMRMQQMMAQILNMLTKAAGMDLELPC